MVFPIVVTRVSTKHVLSAGVFALLIVMALLKYMQSLLSKAEFKYFFVVAALVAPVVVFLVVVGLTYAGIIAPWSGRYSVAFAIARRCCGL
jgi:dolichyl-diphosphooligosaccharide--protein glycosyltransferase